LKIKRKGDKEWVGMHDDKTYVLRGDVDFSTVKDTTITRCNGTMAPDQTYITTTKITRIENQVNACRSRIDMCVGACVRTPRFFICTFIKTIESA